MILTILCYVPQSVEFLGSTTPPFFKPDERHCFDMLKIQLSTMKHVANPWDD